MFNLIQAIFGNKNQREIKRIKKIVAQINQLEAGMQAMTDEQLAEQKDTFKQALESGKSLDQILPQAFATCREVSVRTLGLRHFDVQLIGGIALHEGKVAEMRTGEGKTLVATLAVYVNALDGQGVHVVTVNDYLAERDANWMRPVYEGLGLSVGIISNGQSHESKQAAYACDVIYGTNNEFGFDYLRDNMAFSVEGKVQRRLAFAIVDEVDSILIDEARTPLVISGAAEDHTKLYQQINGIIPKLQLATQVEDAQSSMQGLNNQIIWDGDYIYDESKRSIELTDEGHQKVEELLAAEGLLEAGQSLYSSANLALLHHVHAGLKAHVMFNKNIEYIVKDEQIVIVDEHTGRTMPGRRWSDGIHQAIEAKEGVSIQNESQTMASTTFQNYFRLYDKLSGMTGTADTEAFELRQIYDLDVLVIPTNVQVLRDDGNDLVYMSLQEKFDAIIEEINTCVSNQRPVLVGTASIEMSEMIAQALDKAKIKHNVLNAKQHAKEAEIIAQAGLPGAVTIATNMAGRGTDIVLGGKLEAELEALGDQATPAQVETAKQDWQTRHDLVLQQGGLHIIGTERHESRRIDNQLRGRAGRQGDQGSSRFFLSLEDNLLRIFTPERVKNMMLKLGMEKGVAIEHRMISNAIEKAQRKVEGRNFDIRKQLLEYDDVANDQRSVIYEQRNDLMAAEDIADVIRTIRVEVVNSVIDEYIPPQSLAEQWQVAELEAALKKSFALSLPVQQWLDDDDRLHEEGLRAKILDQVIDVYEQKIAQIGEETIRQFEKQVMLQVIDARWKEHLSTMDMLRQGIHLRGYAQKNPKQEYKREAFNLFQKLLYSIKEDVIRILSNIHVRSREEMEAEQQAMQEAALKRQEQQLQAAKAITKSASSAKADLVTQGNKIGRNDPCPCESGKKYKHCHGKPA